MTRDWDEAVSAMKRVPVWYRRKLLVYVLAGYCVAFGFGWVIGLWLK